MEPARVEGERQKIYIKVGKDMQQRAKEVLLTLKEKNKELSDSIDNYAGLVAKELDIPVDIAKTVVLTDLCKENEKKLILLGLFGLDTLKENGLI